MDSAPRPVTATVSPWDADERAQKASQARIERLLRLGEPLRQRFRTVLAGSAAPRGRALDTLNRIAARAAPAAQRARDGWQRLSPALRARLPEPVAAMTPWLAAPAPAAPDPAQALLAEYAALEPARKERVAKNLALLWDNFQDVFGGISGFQATSETERTAFMDRLGAAAARMEAARGTEAAYHYVTVEMMRQYVACLAAGRRDDKAVALAVCAVALIDRGRRMTEEPMLYSIAS